MRVSSYKDTHGLHEKVYQAFISGPPTPPAEDGDSLEIRHGSLRPMRELESEVRGEIQVLGIRKPGVTVTVRRNWAFLRHVLMQILGIEERKNIAAGRDIVEKKPFRTAFWCVGLMIYRWLEDRFDPRTRGSFPAI